MGIVVLVGFFLLGTLGALGAKYLWDSPAPGLFIAGTALLITGGCVVPPEASGWVMLPGLGLVTGTFAGHGLHWVWRQADPDYARFQDDKREAVRRWIRRGDSRA